MAPPSRLLLVVPTTTYRASAFLTAAAGLAVDVVMATEVASTLHARMGVREVVIDLADADGAAERVVAATAGMRIDGVLGVDESSVLAAAAIASRLGVPHHPVAAVAATRDKRLLRRALAAAGVPQPEWREVASDAQASVLDQALEQLGGPPAVLKPVDQAGSLGVLRVDSLADLEAAVRRVATILDALCAAPPQHPLLLERFAPGPEVAVEGLVRAAQTEILAIFDKPDPLDGPTFAETIYVTPSRHRPAMHAAMTGLVVTAVRALGLTDGPFHAEIRITPAGPVVIEVAARTIGGHCSRVLHLGPKGLSLEEVVVSHAVGLPLDHGLATGPHASAVLMIPVPSAGVMGEVTGLDEARRVPFVDAVEITAPSGSEVYPLPEGARYLGFAFASAPTPVEAEHALRRARDKLQIDVRPFPTS